MACPTRSARQRPITPESASDRSGSSVHPTYPFWAQVCDIARSGEGPYEDLANFG